VITAALPGWKKPTHMCRTFAELPAQAQAYVRRVEQLVGVHIEWIGVGAARCVINVILPLFITQRVFDMVLANVCVSAATR
jgi:adenylosuccinate synthase